MILNQDIIDPVFLSTPLFCNICEKELECIIAVGKYLIFERGQSIYRHDVNHRQFCFVIRGEVELSIPMNGNQIIVGQIGPGGHFGETSLLTNCSDNLNAIALTNVTIFCFDENAFNSILLINEGFHRQLLIDQAKRLMISYYDHANALANAKNNRNLTEHNLDPTFFWIRNLRWCLEIMLSIKIKILAWHNLPWRDKAEKQLIYLATT